MILQNEIMGDMLKRRNRADTGRAVPFLRPINWLDKPVVHTNGSVTLQMEIGLRRSEPEKLQAPEHNGGRQTALQVGCRSHRQIQKPARRMSADWRIGMC